jgi:hypothetical protein
MEYGQQLRYCRAKAYLHVIILFGLKKTFLFRWDASKPSGWTISFSSRSCQGHTSQKHHIHFTLSFILRSATHRVIVLCVCSRGILHVPPVWAKIPSPPPCRQNHFIFHAKNEMLIRFQTAGMYIFTTVPLMGYDSREF